MLVESERARPRPIRTGPISHGQAHGPGRAVGKLSSIKFACPSATYNTPDRSSLAKGLKILVSSKYSTSVSVRSPGSSGRGH